MEDREIKLLLRQRFYRQLDQVAPEALTAQQVYPRVVDLLHGLRRQVGKLPEDQKERIARAVTDDITGWGPLQAVMADPTVTEVMVNGFDRVFVERQGRKRLSNHRFDDPQHLSYIIEKMLRGTGKRLDESSPYVDLSLADGSRINIVVPPVVERGPHMTIRKYLRSIENLEALVQVGSLSVPMAHFLRACIHSRMNMLFSGATGSGKTTIMEILAQGIGPNERLVVIEDTMELRFPQLNVVRLLTRSANIEGKGAVSIRELFQNSLRMRADRIILGEIRGKEALDFLQATNSGHRGSLAVIHASSPEESLIRLENLVHYAGMHVPVNVIRSQIIHGLDLVVQLKQFADGSRKVSRISEVAGFAPDGTVAMRDIFSYREIGAVSVEAGRLGVQGQFLATGTVPRCYHAFRLAGLQIGEDIFRAAPAPPPTR